MGGTVEAYYFAFGENDFYLVADLPDNVTALALSLVGNVSGTINAQVVALPTPEEVDQTVDDCSKELTGFCPWFCALRCSDARRQL